MGSVKQVKVNCTAPQQGFILALSLLMMLFVGLVVITGTQRTGTEQRVAISELHTASVQAAAEAGLYRLRNQLKIACNGLSDPNACATKLKESLSSNAKIAELLDLGEDALGVGIFNSRRTYDVENQLYWWIPEQCPTLDSDNRFTVVSYGEAGSDPSQLRQHVVVAADIEIKSGGCPGCSEEDKNLLDILGKYSTVSSSVVLGGSGKITGIVAANSEPDPKGGASFVGDYEKIEQDKFEEYRTLVNGYFDGFSRLGYMDGALSEVPDLGGYPFRESKISPDGWKGFNQAWNVNAWQDFNLTIHKEQSFLGQSVTVIPLTGLDIASDAVVEVENGNTVIYIDGDVDFRGGGKFIIDSDSSLTLIMTGRFQLRGSFSFEYRDADTRQITPVQQMGGGVLNEYGYPIFSVYTSYKQTKKNDFGVDVGGNTHLYGVIYAANSNVNVSGSGKVSGSVFGDEVEVTGSGEINFATNGVGGGGQPTPEMDTSFDYDYEEGQDTSCL